MIFEVKSFSQFFFSDIFIYLIYLLIHLNIGKMLSINMIICGFCIIFHMIYCFTFKMVKVANGLVVLKAN